MLTPEPAKRAPNRVPAAVGCRSDASALAAIVVARDARANDLPTLNHLSWLQRIVLTAHVRLGEAGRRQRGCSLAAIHPAASPATLRMRKPMQAWFSVVAGWALNPTTSGMSPRATRLLHPRRWKFIVGPGRFYDRTPGLGNLRRSRMNPILPCWFDWHWSDHRLLGLFAAETSLVSWARRHAFAGHWVADHP